MDLQFILSISLTLSMWKKLGIFGKLYVRTLDRGLKEVSYEQIPKNQFEVSAVVILHSIISVDKLAALLAVLT